jgi:DNA-binding response OmpR family regulator
MSTDVMSVLLIEDDPDDVLLVKESLAEISLGKIKLEYTGRLSRGLIELSSHHYDVVLLDLNLPDSRGLETLKTVIKSYPKIPVVVLSGLADDATTLEAVRRGAQDYLVKGEISGPMLVRVLRYAIERKQAEAVLRE